VGSQEKKVLKKDEVLRATKEMGLKCTTAQKKEELKNKIFEYMRTPHTRKEKFLKLQLSYSQLELPQKWHVF